MGVLWEFGQIIYALLALVGLVVVIGVAWSEGRPRLRLWANDVRHGYYHYRTARAEALVRRECVGATVRAQQLIELAKERMSAVTRSGF